MASAAEECNWLQSLFDGSEASEVDASSVTPSHVFRATSDLISEIQILRGELGVCDYPVEAERQEDRAPVHVNLQTKLGMDASAVPTLTLARITPSEVYDATNMVLAEMSRIKVHLDINLPHEPRTWTP